MRNPNSHSKPRSQLGAILASLEQLESVRVHGACGSARAWILSNWAATRMESRRDGIVSEPLLVLCANDDRSEELQSELRVLSEVFFRGKIRAERVPSWEQSPYGSISPALRTRFERLATLAALRSARPPQIVLGTLAAFGQATLPAEQFTRASLAIQSGSNVESREALARRLRDAGYFQVETVEDPGTFAVRGDLIDVYAPGHDFPLRIELFGDEIEKIRSFAPDTQRTFSEDPARPSGSGELLLPPAREALIHSETLALVRERVKQSSDDRGIHRSVRDPVLRGIQEHSYPEHADTWASFCYPTRADFWSHCPAESPVVWDDELTCLQEWDDFLARQNALFAQNRVIAPAPAALFGDPIEAERRVRARKRLYFDRLELAPPSSQIPTEANESPEAQPETREVAPAHRLGCQETFKGNLPRPAARGLSREEIDSAPPLPAASPVSEIARWLQLGETVVILASTEGQTERLRRLLEQGAVSATVLEKPEKGSPVAGKANIIRIESGDLVSGFRWPAERTAVVPANEILGTRKKKGIRSGRSTGATPRDWAGLKALNDLQLGDPVVHVDHGIGRYQGIARLELSGAPSDFLVLEYANRDKLYLPVYRLNVIQKYSGSGEGVNLDRLGSQSFAKAKEQVRTATRELATDLLSLYAERKIRSGIPFAPRDSLFARLEESFSFEETPDQFKAIEDTLADLEAGRPMDRLICGDVGFGKTEVAIRAAFLAVLSGKQVAVLVPTTVLALQHEQSFRSRLNGLPVVIDSVSRFKSPKEQKRVLRELESGKIDLVIGTHRLLSRDVKFRDLGLVIVDEEHRFGVEHKEKLKTLKVNAPVLTLSATPIPRTLHMALSGLRDISLITTPPVQRLPVRTFVARYDEELIQRAIETELSRGGQVFFIHNRVQSIRELASRLAELVPSATIAIAHGQMPEEELEKAMLGFYEKKANVLVCTTIIESGLDVPSANTILINRADTLGLAQLYQIRGRVGRGDVRAYAYLLLPPESGITEDARKRLEVIQKFVELGSGFSVASHDLELRGGGNILGVEQSGHIASVGFDLYLELLEQAIAEARGRPPEASESKEPEIKMPFPAFLGEDYISDVHERLSLYRRLSSAPDETELEALEGELRDRFGPLPPESLNLLWLIRIKQLLKRHHIDALTVGPKRISLLVASQGRAPSGSIDPTRVLALMAAEPDKFQLMPDSRLVVTMGCASVKDLFFAIEKLLTRISFPGAS